MVVIAGAYTKAFRGDRRVYCGTVNVSNDVVRNYFERLKQSWY